MSSAPAGPVTLLIASYLEPEHVARIRAVDERLEVVYAPELLAAPRYPADHYGVAARSPAEEARWQALLARAEIMFDFDFSHRQDLPDLAPRLRWLQATSAGIGQFIKQSNYDVRLPETVFTTAAGIHARPLAEFCVMAMLMHAKRCLPTLHNQQHKHWQRFSGADLAGQTVGIIGLGRIGSEVARLSAALGLRVIATQSSASSPHVAQTFPRHDLAGLLAQCDFLVLCVPHTPATENIIGPREFSLLKQGAYVINIARGVVIDEDALIAALRSGQVSGAALDVFREEPLPPGSPFWEMDNVLVSAHSASTSDSENERLTELFCENLRRYLSGQALLNQLIPDRYY